MKKNSQNILMIICIISICCVLGCTLGFSFAFFIDRNTHDGAGNVAILEIDIVYPQTNLAPTLSNLTSPVIPLNTPAQTFSGNSGQQLLTLSTAGNTISGYLKATIYVEWYENSTNTKDPYDGSMYVDDTLEPTVEFTFATTTSNATINGHWRKLEGASIFDEYYFCKYDSDETVPEGHERDELVSVPANITINFLTSVSTDVTLPAIYADGTHYYVINVEVEIEQIP